MKRSLFTNVKHAVVHRGMKF